MRRLFIAFLIFGQITLIAQDDLLAEIESEETEIKEETQSVFKALQIVTSQSTKTAGKKDLYFVVSHRFGSIADGFDEFFGLDNATTRIGFIYGLTDDLSLSISRHTFQKTWELGSKYKFLWQKENGFPISVATYNVIGINSELDDDDFPRLNFQDRLHYTNQFLISRKFSNHLSFQLTPSWVHRNLIDEPNENEDQFSLGAGGRVRLSPSLTLNTEFFYNFDKPDLYTHPLSIGLDVETGGHVFQLVLSNSQPMTEAGYISNALGEWESGEIFFGFNLYRVF